MGDTIKITVPNPIEVTVTTGVLDVSRVATRVIAQDSAYMATDDVIILNASAQDVSYEMPEDPSDNEQLEIVASNITHTASINWNGKSFQDDTDDYIFYAAYEPLRVRFIASLDKWIKL